MAAALSADPSDLHATDLGHARARADAMMPTGPWNWLEVAKLVAGLLTPLALALLGVHVHRVTKRFEHLQWRSQKLIEKRLAIYDELAPLLNDLLCYFSFVGGWRDMDPPEVVALKRSIDKKVFLAAPLFSGEFFNACMAFQALCFETYTGWGRDPRLRTHSARRREGRSADWKEDWNALFSGSVASPQEVRVAYKRVMESFSQDIGVYVPTSIPVHGNASRK